MKLGALVACRCGLELSVSTCGMCVESAMLYGNVVTISRSVVPVSVTIRSKMSASVQQHGLRL